MASTPGYSFAPTFENAEQGRRGGSPADFPQGSIKVLNFQLPRIAGAPGPNAPSPLTSDTPSGGFGNAVLQSVLRTILGPDQSAAFTGAMPSAGNDAPGHQSRDNGSDLLDNFPRRERNLGNTPAPRTDSPSYDEGTGFHPIPSSPAPPPSVRVQQPPDNSGAPPQAPETPRYDNGTGFTPIGGGERPSAPNFDEPAPRASQWSDKYDGGWGTPDFQTN